MATVDETMAELESLGTEQNRKVYPRHGVTEPLFGVSYANIGKLQKRLKTDQLLAEELWATGNHDARVLASRIADPDAFDDTLADAWAQDCDNYVLCEGVVGVVARSPVARSRGLAWKDDPGEWVASCGWGVVASHAETGTFTDAEYGEFVDQIRREIHDRPNRVRHEMNTALIALALRDPDLRERALRAAEEIGPVEVDHGETGCKTQAVAPYVERTLAHREKQAAKRKARDAAKR